MSEAQRPRRGSAEIRWDGDPGAVVWVGSRTIHQYWPLLSGYFRDILLPPHRRADESVVTWTWREPANAKPPSASELATLRKRLAADHQLFAENLTRGLGGGDAGGLPGQGNVDELGAAIAGAITQLVARADSDLGAFVCRTENGLRVHSWGAPAAGRVTYPETEHREIGGHVVVRGRPAARHGVVLEAHDGESVARTQTDPAGAFRFQKIAAGRYRLLAEPAGGGERFPAGGLAVVVERESVTGLVLRDEAPRAERVPMAPRRWPRRAAAAAMALVIAGGAAWFLMRRAAERPDAGRGSIRGGELNSARARAAEEAGATADEARPGIATEVKVSVRDATTGVGSTVPSQMAAARLAQGGGGGAEGAVVSGSIPHSDTVEERRLSQAASPNLPPGAAGSPSPTNAALSGPTGASSRTAGAGHAAVGTSGSGATESGALSGAGSAKAAETLAAGAMPKTRRPTTELAEAAHRGEDALEAKKPAPSHDAAGENLPAGAVTVSAEAEASGAGASGGSRPVDTAVAGETAAAPAEPVHDAAPTEPSEAMSVAGVKMGRMDFAASNASEPAVFDATERDADDERDPSFFAQDEVAGVPRSAPGLSSSPWTRVRVGEWRVRLLADVILPTVPTERGELEQLNELRERIRTREAGRMPDALREPKVRYGFSFAANGNEGRALAWSGTPGAEPSSATVRGGQAEISWEAADRAGTPVVLLQGATVLAEVRREEDAMVFRVAPGVRAGLWIGLRTARNVPPTGAWEWRSTSGGPLPFPWRQEPAGAMDETPRAAVSMSAADAVAVQGIAVLDAASGWAGFAEVRVATDEDLGAVERAGMIPRAQTSR